MFQAICWSLHIGITCYSQSLHVFCSCLPYRNISTQAFIAAWFTIAKRWIEMSINEKWNIYKTNTYILEFIVIKKTYYNKEETCLVKKTSQTRQIFRAEVMDKLRQNMGFHLHSKTDCGNKYKTSWKYLNLLKWGRFYGYVNCFHYGLTKKRVTWNKLMRTFLDLVKTSFLIVFLPSK